MAERLVGLVSIQGSLVNRIFGGQINHLGQENAVTNLGE